MLKSIEIIYFDINIHKILYSYHSYSYICLHVKSLYGQIVYLYALNVWNKIEYNIK